MGWNTVVVLFNDMMSEWPDEIATAYRMRRADGRGLRESAWFGFGRVASTDHSSGTQIVAAGGNTARRLDPSDPAEPADLDALSLILRGHGYTVRRPGRTRGEGPLSWGYAARPAPETEGKR